VPAKPEREARHLPDGGSSEVCVFAKVLAMFCLRSARGASSWTVLQDGFRHSRRRIPEAGGSDTAAFSRMEARFAISCAELSDRDARYAQFIG
jgi:hypothetical protein